MQTEISVVGQRDDNQDYGLLVRFFGETDLEKIFLSHLQLGHTVELGDSDDYGHGELQIVLNNKASGKVEKPQVSRRRNRK